MSIKSKVWKVCRILIALVLGLFGLIFLLVVAVVLMGVHEDAVMRHRESTLLEPEIVTIKSLGGRVSWSAPDQLDVEFRNKDIAEPHIKALTALRTMQQRLGFSFSLNLSFYKSRFSDNSLAFLGDLPPVISLDISHAKVTPDILKELEHCSSLNVITLSGTCADDVSLEAIARLPELRNINLDNTAISDSGLVALQGASNLTSISIANTSVTDSGVASFLKGDFQLEHLNLSGCPVGHQTMSEIGKHTNLWSLSLVGTQITDSDLEHLYRLKYLRFLDVSGTNVTTNAINELKSNLPRRLWVIPLLRQENP